MRQREGLISLVCPTRNRPDNVLKLVHSARTKAAVSDDVQFVFYVDQDDGSFPLSEEPGVAVVRGPRMMLSLLSNACLPAARGDILMYAADDLEFLSEGWDAMVREQMAAMPDRILLVHGNDMGQDPRRLATHGFLHRRWIETVGYLLPPYFAAEWTDTWLTEVADRISRRCYIPELIIEHQHYAWGKGALDETHRERLRRLETDRPGLRFSRLTPERRNDARKLLAVMDDRRLPAIKRMGLPSWWVPRRGTRVLHRPRWLR